VCKKWVGDFGKDSHGVAAWVAGIDDGDGVRAFGSGPVEMGKSTLNVVHRQSLSRHIMKGGKKKKGCVKFEHKHLPA
jgi:hypothetical protein